MFLLEDIENIVTARIQSSRVSAKNSTKVQVGGSCVVGCYAHITSVIWNLSYARYPLHVSRSFHLYLDFHEYRTGQFYFICSKCVISSNNWGKPEATSVALSFVHVDDCRSIPSDSNIIRSLLCWQDRYIIFAAMEVSSSALPSEMASNSILRFCII